MVDISHFIEGYSLLSEEEHTDFEATTTGKAFIQLIEEAEHFIQLHETSKWPVKKWLSAIIGQEQWQKEELINQCRQQQAQTISILKESPDYKLLRNKIILKLLAKEDECFRLFTLEQQLQVAETSFSQKLYENFPFIELTEELQPVSWFDISQKIRLDELSAKKKEVLHEWREKFATAEEMAILKNALVETRIINRATELTASLPFAKAGFAANPVILLKEAYAQFEDKEQLAEAEEQFLARLIVAQLQETTNSIVCLDLQEFNHHYAHILAQKLRFARNAAEAVADWLKEYKNALTHRIQQTLGLERVFYEPASPEIMTSLSYFWNNGAVRTAQDFMERMATAHLFMQYTGFSAQGESDFWAILDLYNIHRFSDQIRTTKAILTKLLLPFKPLVQEYKEIALYEKNFYRKVFKTVMPLLIIAGVLVLGGALLSLIGIPELAFLAAAIPLLLIGVALATKYITVKNKACQWLHETIHGGPFEIPQFQVNERMNLTFGNVVAQDLRDIYIEAIKACAEQEKIYSLKAKQGILTQEEIEDRKKNITQRHTLYMEWYDIHSNKELGADHMPLIAKKRLHEIHAKEYQQLEEILQTSEHCAEEFINDLKPKLINNESIQVTINHSARFFSSCVTQREKINKIRTCLLAP